MGHNAPTAAWLHCRLCDSNRLLSVLDLGATPHCEKFLTPGELDLPEPTFPLHLRLCEDCLLLQIPALIGPEGAITEYLDFSSFSDTWVQHSKKFVKDTIKRLGLSKESLVVEVASNDGYLLQHVVAAGIPCLGIEPSVNVGVTARERGVPTISAFLDESLARQVRAEHGPADLVVANNVYTRIPDLRGFTRSLRMLLADDGWLSIEVHHALKLVSDAQFDTIDHEHFQYFSLLSATRALATAGLAVVDAELLPTLGGSLRVWARPARIAAPPSARVIEVLRTETLRHNLLRFLLQCRADGKRVVGYGAPGRANTLLNYCGIRSDLLDYIVDRNPYKYGRFTPGTRVPIHDPKRIAADRPDVVLALSRDLEAELNDQLSYTAEWGAKLVFPPTPQRPSMLMFNGNGAKLP